MLLIDVSQEPSNLLSAYGTHEIEWRADRYQMRLFGHAAFDFTRRLRFSLTTSLSLSQMTEHLNAD